MAADQHAHVVRGRLPGRPQEDGRVAERATGRAGAAVRELLELTGSVCLATAFEDRYPEYPKFTVKLIASNLKQPTEDVIRWLAGGVKNNLATAVLDGLELLDGEKLKPHNSRYAKVVLEKLEAKPPGQVVNRKELITVKNDVEREAQYQLEPEFLLIVLASLVQNGNITLSVPGKKLDAANLGEATKTPLEQLVAVQACREAQGPAAGRTGRSIRDAGSG